MLDLALVGNIAQIRHDYTFMIAVFKKKGINHVPEKDKQLRAISYIELGTEFVFKAYGHMFEKNRYGFNVHRSYKKILQELANDENYLTALS